MAKPKSKTGKPSTKTSGANPKKGGNFKTKGKGGFGPKKQFKKKPITFKNGEKKPAKGICQKCFKINFTSIFGQLFTPCFNLVPSNSLKACSPWHTSMWPNTSTFLPIFSTNVRNHYP